MSLSLIENKKRCYVCKKDNNTAVIEKHHIYFGPYKRPKSEEYGCWVYLCHEHHQGQTGVHKNLALNLELKRKCQEAFEKKYDHITFIKVFGKSYL